jgi:two-component system phosphate regulon sensor histidine kinase PhoR
MAAPDDRAGAARRDGTRAGVLAIWLVAGLSCAVLLAVFLADTPRPLHAAAGVAAIVAAALAAAGWLRWVQSPQTTQAAQSAMQDSGLLDVTIEAIADPIIVLDRNERVIAFNRKASDIAPGLRRGDPALLALRVPELVEAIRRASGSGLAQRAEFAERIPSDRHFEAFIVPMPSTANAGAAFLMVTFHDLTPIRRVEDMRADFVANASHELRTPLAALSGFIETLRGAARDDPAARERFLGIMEQQARRMARLIDDLLSLSRIELNAHLRPDTPVELGAILRQVIDSLQMLARERGVEVRLVAPEPVIVAGDRDELIRVFENLVENALKYGGEGKRVDVVLSSSGSEGIVAVRDYGPGIAAEHLPRLTERFYRVDVAGSRALGGTGLGLALVKHILNRHRGRLNIDSKAGQGATFTVRIPLHNPQGS